MTETMDDFKGDRAGTHASTAGVHDRVPESVTDADLAALLDQGFVILPDLLSPDELDRIKHETKPWLTHFGRNALEGTRTKRAYSVVAKTNSCNPLAEHPRILCLLDRLLLPNYLISMFQAIELHPGQKAQVLHHDDAFYPIPRPRPAISAASILAVDDFTETNGATVILPGSHRWGDERPADHAPVPVVMPAGSAIVFLGTLWHGGGANRSEGTRLAVTCQYCEPWARTLENMSLAVPREVAASCSETMQRMLGYSIHFSFMGNVDGVSPMRVLDLPPR